MKSIYLIGALVLVMAIQACGHPSSGSSGSSPTEGDQYGFSPNLTCTQAGTALLNDFSKIIDESCEQTSDCVIGTAEAGSNGCVSSDWAVMNKGSVQAFQNFVCSAEFAKFMSLGSWNCWLVEPIAPPPASDVVCTAGTCQLSGF
jgi:hypothetical protein